MRAVNNVRWSIGFSVLLCVCLSCGYRFAGSGHLPGGVQNVSIAIFKNNTAETGLENTFTNDLIYEFIRSGRSVAPNPDSADAVISGTIHSIGIESAARIDSSESSERRVTIIIDLKLTGKNGRVIWSARGLSQDQTFIVEDDKQATEENKDEALDYVSKRLAEYAFRRMTDDF